MLEASRHDAWQAGDRYEAYMGRWSSQIVPLFLDGLSAGDNLDWLDIGCGSGALSAAILRSLTGPERTCRESGGLVVPPSVHRRV
jgi:hypothetical protein